MRSLSITTILGAKHSSNQVSSCGKVMKAKWLEEEVIVMGLSDGTVQMKDIRTKKAEKASEMI